MCSSLNYFSQVCQASRSIQTLCKNKHIKCLVMARDKVYLGCTDSSIQIWLRGQQQKVGRLSTGSKVTSLLAANDIIFCGTENGLTKGWIPL
ncbi:hypothetical protein BHM03_00019723 [Ensete ventricosum]|nr:hypothetical protein BHM03_00019723 [Ensete ventricosum]